MPPPVQSAAARTSALLLSSAAGVRAHSGDPGGAARDAAAQSVHKAGLRRERRAEAGRVGARLDRRRERGANPLLEFGRVLAEGAL